MGRCRPHDPGGDVNDEEKPRLPAWKRPGIETINLEDAMQLFQLPRTLEEYEGQEISVNIGRFGPYVKAGEQFIFLFPKEKIRWKITLGKRAIELVQEKQKKRCAGCIWWETRYHQG